MIDLKQIQNVYQRSAALERRIRFRAAYPEGIVPYLKKLEYDGTIAGPGVSGEVRSPPTTVSFHKRFPLEDFPKQDYVYKPSSTMRYIGKMDGYAFNSSIPKFDPWFRSVLKDKSPETVRSLENTYVRDPCTPDRVLKHFSLYDREWKRMPTGKRMAQAKHITKKMFEKIGQVDVIDFNYEGWHQILPSLEMTSSPGLPLRREYVTQGECLGFIYDRAKRLNHFAKFLSPDKVRAPPCMIGLRPGLLRRSELDTKVKARGVWAYPAEVKVLEMRFVIPLMKRMASLFGKTPYPVGINATKALPMMIDHLLHDGKYGFVTDVSKLDTSIGPDYIDFAFDLLSNHFYFGYTKSSETRNRNVFEFLKYYHKRTPILLPSGALYRKRGGVPSGSGFTQWVDTITTVLMTVYGMLTLGYHESDIINKLFVVGDDMATGVPHDFDIHHFTRVIGMLGFEINPDKVMFSNKGIELKFLGYSKNGGNIFRPLDELLQTALFPEKFVGNLDRSRQRILGQTIASGLCDPFLSKVNYFMGDMANQLPPDPGEIFIPQKRWMQQVLGIEEMPTTTIVFDLFPLV